MKSKILTILVVLCFSYAAELVGQGNGNFVIIINGDSVYIDLDSTKMYKSKSGETIGIRLTQPSIITYRDSMLTFKHWKELSVSRSTVDKGIEQVVVVNANGSGYIIQEYKTMDPSSLVNLMLEELTKESISYGYTKKEKKFEKKLKSGETITGVEATLTYKGDSEVYTVSTYGGKDEGILVITMLLNEDFKKADQPLLDLFLKTLSLNH